MGGSKRKSEGDLPRSKRPFRKTTGSEEEDESEGEASSGELFVPEQPSKARRVKKPATKPTRKSEPVKRVTYGDVEKGMADDDEEEGEPAMESQQFLELVQLQQQKKAQVAKSTTEFIKKFNSIVDADEKALKKKIADLSDEANKRDKDFLEAFHNAFLSSRPKAAPVKESTRGKSTPTTMAFALLQERCQELTNNATSIISKFEEAKEMTANMVLSDLIDVKAWNDATDRIEEEIDSGYRAGIQICKRMRSKNPDGVNIEEEAANGATVNMFYPEDRHQGPEGWGEYAHQIEKATKKFVKILAPRQKK